VSKQFKIQEMLTFSRISTFMLLLILAASAGHAALEGPCEKDLETFCSGVKMGNRQMSGCLHTYRDQLSKECNDYLTTYAVALNQFQDACSEDAFVFCRDVKTSYRRMVHCLKEHLNDVSSDCRTLLKPKK
jgi:hypothetical protein